MGDWHTADTLRAAWPELPAGDLGDDLVEAAKDACLDHLTSEGITHPGEGKVPARYRLAQQMQARAIYEDQRIQPVGDPGIGMPGYQAIATGPMGKKIRDLLGYRSLGIG